MTLNCLFDWKLIWYGKTEFCVTHFLRILNFAVFVTCYLDTEFLPVYVTVIQVVYKMDMDWN